MKLRWCSHCRYAAPPDEHTEHVTNMGGEVLRTRVTETCPRCDRPVHEHVSGPTALSWATAQWEASGRVVLDDSGALTQVPA